MSNFGQSAKARRSSQVERLNVISITGRRKDLSYQVKTGELLAKGPSSAREKVRNKQSFRVKRFIQ